MSFLLRPKTSSTAKKRIFCFTHAGGSASSFVPWAKALAPDLELYAIQLPGRGHRISEPNMVDAEELFDEIALDVEALLDKPFLFFGHSMGSLLAFEVARLLRREKLRLPERLFISAFVAPPLLNDVHVFEGTPIHLLRDDALVRFIRSLGSTAAEQAFEDAELRALAIPPIRADFELLYNYRLYEEPPLEVPCTAIAGSFDPLAKPDLVEAWRRHFADFTFVRRDKGHFLIEDDTLFLLDLIRSP